MQRTLTERDLAYERIGTRWSEFIASYDTRRRVEVLVDEFLGAERIEGRTCLEAGCGLGDFTARMRDHGPASLSSCDIAPTLVAGLHRRVPEADAFVADLLRLDEALAGRQFDVVLSSEVIEHTPDPQRALEQLAKAVKPGGFLAVSVPNRRWIWLLYLAQTGGLRPHYQGYENWVRPDDLVRWIESAGLILVRREGVHAVPWQFLPKRLLRRIDQRFRSAIFPTALNLAILARKPLEQSLSGSPGSAGMAAAPDPIPESFQ